MRVSTLVPAILFVSLLPWPISGLSDTKCAQYNIVESMPDGLSLKDPEGANVVRTHDSLISMTEKSKSSIRIASLYWYLTPPQEFDNHAAALPGRMLMDAIKRAASRGVSVEVVLDGSGRKEMSNPDDVRELGSIGIVKFVNMTRLLSAGVMHTKFMIADNASFYLGSSNFDWRSYTEIKEMGLTMLNCSQLAQDLDKIFRTYMLMADSKVIPSPLSNDLKTSINIETPLKLRLCSNCSHDDEAELASVFLAGSPLAFNGGKTDWTGRTDDIDALLHLIRSARKRISISVMNYSPRMEFVWHKQYWPRIDDALRQAATTRSVKVELLFSNWSSTRSSELAWYRSLNALQSSEFHNGGIHVKLFQVPAFDDYQRRIPFARVKHDKYMVTESGVYLGTSNWTPDYFVNTAGASILIQPQGEQKQAGSRSTLALVRNFQAIFDRDFGSEYAHELSA